MISRINASDRLKQALHGHAPSLRHAVSYAAQDIIVSADLVRNKQVSKRLMKHFEVLSVLATCIPLSTEDEIEN